MALVYSFNGLIAIHLHVKYQLATINRSWDSTLDKHLNLIYGWTHVGQPERSMPLAGQGRGGIKTCFACILMVWTAFLPIFRTKLVLKCALNCLKFGIQTKWNAQKYFFLILKLVWNLSMHDLLETIVYPIVFRALLIPEAEWNLLKKIKNTPATSSAAKTAENIIYLSRAMRKCVLFHMRTTKAQISLLIRTVWSAPLSFPAKIV